MSSALPTHRAVSSAIPTAGQATGNAGEGLFILAGVIVAAAGWRRNHQVGEWWWRALIGTIGLCVVAALFSRTKAAPVVKGLAWITLISSCIYAVPAFKNAPAAGSKYKGKAPGGSNNPGGSPTEGTRRN